MKFINYYIATNDNDPRNKIHVVHKDKNFIYKSICGTLESTGYVLGAKVRDTRDLKKITCKRCKGHFDGTISKQNSKNARGQKTHPWNQTRYGNGSRGTRSVFESSI